MSPSRQGSAPRVPSGRRRRHLPTFGERGGDDGGDIGRLPFAQDVGRRAVVVGLGAEQHDRRTRDRVGALGLQRHVLRLRLRLGDDQVAEHVVHELDDRTGRAVVAGEALWRCAERRTGAEERGDVGASEPVDRLLRVADHEQPAGIRRELVPATVARVGFGRGEEGGEVALDGVGVLELVEEEAGVAGAEAAPYVPAVLGVAQQRTRQHEEVVELELAVPPPFRRFAQGELGDLPREPTGGCLGGGPPQLRGQLLHRGHPPADGVDVAVRRPVALLAELGVQAREPRAQHPQLLVLVGRCEHADPPGRQLRELRDELVVGVGAMVGLRDHRVDLGEQLLDREGWRVGFGPDAFLDEVPVGVARHCERAQLVTREVRVDPE